MHADEPVSVVICAHNELYNLKRLIPQLMHQDYPNYEVIVVDDRSSDGSESWLKKQQADHRNLRLVSVKNVPQGLNPKKHALVKGIETAANDLLLLTDADCVPASNNWIRLMAGSYRENTQMVLGYSGYQTRPGLLNQLIRYETLLTAIQYLSRALDSQPYMGVGRNLSYRKSFFKQTGGLEGVMPVTGGDDDLFVNRVAGGDNTEVCIDPEAATISQPEKTWLDYFRQKLRHLSVGRHYRSRDIWLLGIFSVSHIVFWCSLVSLLVTQTQISWVVVGFFIRQLTLSWVVKRSSRNLGEHINSFYVPLLDFIYSLFYLVTGLLALGGKKVVWH